MSETNIEWKFSNMLTSNVDYLKSPLDPTIFKEIRINEQLNA